MSFRPGIPSQHTLKTRRPTSCRHRSAPFCKYIYIYIYIHLFTILLLSLRNYPNFVMIILERFPPSDSFVVSYTATFNSCHLRRCVDAVCLHKSRTHLFDANFQLTIEHVFIRTHIPPCDTRGDAIELDVRWGEHYILGVCVCLSMSSFRCVPDFPPMVRLIPC